MKQTPLSDEQAAVMDRVLRKVRKSPTGCWLWTGASTRGYGTIKVGNRKLLVRRVVFELRHGAAGDQTVESTCYNPLCCCPDHLILGVRGKSSGRNAR